MSSKIALILQLVGCAWIAGCSTKGSPVKDSGGPARDVAAVDTATGHDAVPDAPVEPELPLTVTELGSGTLGDAEHHFRLLKLERGDLDASYALMFSPHGSTPTPVVLLTRPYSGISWTGEAVDIEYCRTQGELSIEEMYENATIWLVHEVAVLNVFARFYAGGELRNDVDDIVAGLAFLAQEPSVDQDRIGIFGSSWGGFEALFGAANAPSGATPRAGVAQFPPSDFMTWVGYVRSLPDLVGDSAQLKTWQDFFAPYLERIYASTGGAPDTGDFTPWTTKTLLAQLDTPFLLVHDQWDTLVPFSQSTALRDASNGLVELLSFRQPQPLTFDGAELTHGDLQSAGVEIPLYSTFVANYLLTRLAGPAQTIYSIYDPSALSKFLIYLKAQQPTQVEPGYALTGLVDFCDSRVVAIDCTAENPWAGELRSGADVLVPLINTLWCAELTAASLPQTLAKGLPPDGCNP